MKIVISKKGDTMKLGEYLVENHLVTSKQLIEALDIQQKEPEQKIGEILVRLGVITPDILQKALDSNH